MTQNINGPQGLQKQPDNQENPGAGALSEQGPGGKNAVTNGTLLDNPPGSGAGRGFIAGARTDVFFNTSSLGGNVGDQINNMGNLRANDINQNAAGGSGQQVPYFGARNAQALASVGNAPSAVLRNATPVPTLYIKTLNLDTLKSPILLGGPAVDLLIGNVIGTQDPDFSPFVFGAAAKSVNVQFLNGTITIGTLSDPTDTPAPFFDLSSMSANAQLGLGISGTLAVNNPNDNPWSILGGGGRSVIAGSGSATAGVEKTGTGPVLLADSLVAVSKISNLALTDIQTISAPFLEKLVVNRTASGPGTTEVFTDNIAGIAMRNHGPSTNVVVLPLNAPVITVSQLINLSDSITGVGTVTINDAVIDSYQGGQVGSVQGTALVLLGNVTVNMGQFVGAASTSTGIASDAITTYVRKAGAPVGAGATVITNVSVVP